MDSRNPNDRSEEISLRKLFPSFVNTLLPPPVPTAPAIPPVKAKKKYSKSPFSFKNSFHCNPTKHPQAIQPGIMCSFKLKKPKKVSAANPSSTQPKP